VWFNVPLIAPSWDRRELPPHEQATLGHPSACRGRDAIAWSHGLPRRRFARTLAAPVVSSTDAFAPVPS
jgi:hypothetical protein